ncbi:MAG TPA: fatty acid desaturase [Polyangiaceae bacterium]
MENARQDKELIDATRPFAVENKAKSWFAVLSTLVLLGGALSVAFVTPTTSVGWALRTFASVVAGLLTVRMFILYHDHLHGALLRSSMLAKPLFTVYGMLIMTPPKVWRETHNYHHANTAKIVGSHVGSYMMVTTGMWAKMTPRERLMYKTIRHPLTIMAGYFTLFMLGMGISPFLRAPKKHWASLAGVLLNWALSGLLIWKLGFVTFIFGMFLPLAISMMSGGYLFYAQHNFPDIYVQPRESWSYTRAALESSSYMEMGPIMRYFTGSIGYHHVHHLNSMVPFYRLAEAMEAIPELRHPRKTSLRPGDVLACFRLKLWDPDAGKMVGYPSDATSSSMTPERA